MDYKEALLNAYKHKKIYRKSWNSKIVFCLSSSNLIFRINSSNKERDYIFPLIECFDTMKVVADINEKNEPISEELELEDFLVVSDGNTCRPYFLTDSDKKATDWRFIG